MRHLLILCVAALTAAQVFAGTARADIGPVNVEKLVSGKPSPRLSTYNLFKNAARQAPNEGLVPYHLNTPLFSDYALKYRFLYLPEGQQALYRENEVFDFPTGTVLVKTFGFPADLRMPDQNIRIIETRLLVREADRWVAWPYIWNEDVSEARLKVTGARVPVSFTHTDGTRRDFSYLVPNKNQCKGCHANGKDITLIGPKARNLNGPYPYAHGAENQLTYWARSGHLSGAPPAEDAPRVPVWNDPRSGTLADRAKAYLDINCAHCHRPTGPGRTSGLYLDYTETNDRARGIWKRPVAAGRGSGDLEFVIKPGAPDESILIYRMESLHPGVAMPELARSLTHNEGVALIRAYVGAMKP